MQSISSKQTNLINSIEAINDILVSEIKKNKEKRVLEHVEQFNKHIENLFSLNESRFKELMFNPDSEGSSEYLFWEFKKYSTPFSLIMRTYANLYQAAIEINSQKIILEIEIGFNQILTFLTPSIEESKSYVDYIKLLEIYFTDYTEVLQYAIKKENNESHTLCYRWYTRLIFNPYGNYEVFNLDLFPYLSKKLFQYLIYSIDRTNQRWFREFVSWMHHGIGFLNSEYSNIYDFIGYESYDEFEYNDIEDIDNTFTQIRTKKELDIWLKKFNVIKDTVVNKYTRTEQANEIIYKAYQQYLFFNLKQLINGLSAYLVYRRRYDFILELWDFRQPKESTSQWIGHSIIPETVQEILELSNISYMSDYCFKDEHIDCKYYLNRYALYRLIYLVSEPGYQNPNKYIGSTDEIEINSIKSYIEKLESNLNDVLEDKETLELLRIKYTEEKNIRKIFNTIKNECENQLDYIITNNELDSVKVEKFKQGYIDTYKTSSGIKHFIKYFKSYNNSLEHVKEEYKFGVNRLTRKDVFNSKLFAGADMFGSNFARNMIEGENQNIFSEIIENVTKHNGTIKDICHEINPENMLIIVSANRNLRHNKNFIGAWKSKNKLELSSFQGWYKLDKIEIPVFHFNTSIKDKYIILDKTKLPKINQFSPLNTNNLLEEFYISIQDMKNNESLIDTITAKESSQEAKNKKREELIKKAQIEIYESYEIVFDNFKGFILEGGENVL